MSRFQSFDETNAPEDSRTLLGEQKAKLGFLAAPLTRTAGSPAALSAMISMLDRLEACSLGAAEREVLAFVLGYENACGYCMALHTVLAKQVAGVAGDIDALRRGAPPSDPRLAVFASFVRAALTGRGEVSDAAWTAFRDAGYTEENALDVVVGISTYTLTTFANRMVEAPLDPFLERFRWDESPQNRVA